MAILNRCASLANGNLPLLLYQPFVSSSNVWRARAPQILPPLSVRFCELKTKASAASTMTSAPAAAVEQNVKDFSQIPGPKSLPLIGSILHIITHKEYDRKSYFKIWKSFLEEYGQIVKVKSYHKLTIVATCNADDIEVLFKATMKKPIRHGFQSLKYVRLANKDNYFNKRTGVLTENGDEWWRVRSRVQAPVLKPQNVAMYLPMVDSTTKAFMKRIDLLQAETGLVPGDFLQELYKWSLESVGHVALDRKLGCLDPNVTPDSLPMQLIGHLNDLFIALNATEMGLHTWKFFRTSAYRQLEKTHAAFLELALGAIKQTELRFEEAKAQGNSERRLTIMETFLNTEGLSRSDVATIIIDLIAAGVDTTAHTVGFALYLLSRNPELQKRLQQRVDAVVKKDEPLTSEHIATLDCIVHVVKETLRLYPLTFAHVRILTEDVVMSGYRIPARTAVVGFHSVASRMEKYFPRALEFRPERWQRDRPLGEIHPYASLPFSHGTRMCLGKRLAEQEIYTFLIRILQNYTVSYESSKEMEVKTELILKPTAPLIFKFHPRN